MKPVAAPSVRTLLMDSFHPEMMDEAVHGGRMDHIQLGRGRFHGVLLKAHLEDSDLDWGGYNLPLLASGAMPADRITLGYILAMSDEGNLNGFRFREPAPALFGEGGELHYHLAPGTQWAAFQLTRAALEPAGVSLPPRATLIMPRLDAELRQRLQQTLTNALALLREIERAAPGILDPGALGVAIREDLLAAFAVALEPACSSAIRLERRWDLRLRLVRRAEAFLDAHLTQPVQIARLCAATGASMKTLERAFLEIHGVTPKRFLTALRMSRARRTLLAGAKDRLSVAQVAVDCGVFHLGRFAVEYRSLYGESPSATRSRC